MRIRIGSNITVEDPPDEVLISCLIDNTFPNPAFVSNSKNHRYNGDTPKEIYTYSKEGKNLVLPRGYARELLNTCKAFEIEPTIIDERSSAPCEYPDSLEGITLRDYQERAVTAAGKFDQGSIISPTGSGKSFIGLEIIRRKRQKALIIVHREQLARQWAQTIKERLGIEAGFIGGDDWTVGDQITLAMVQTLASREDETRSLSNAFGTIIADEEHHLPCSTFFSVIGLLKAKYRYGLSATPNRSDGLEEMIYRAVGPAISEISREEVEGIGATVPATIIPVETGFDPGSIDTWSEYVDSLSNIGRNRIILDLAANADGSALVLVDRVAHAQELSDMLTKEGVDHVLAHGKVDRVGLMDKIKASKLTVATCSLIGEGVDVDSWGTLVMGAPISSEIKLMQAIGRCVRPAPGKEQALVYDLKDDCGFSGSSFQKRYQIYRKHNIWVDFKGAQRRAG